MPGALTWDPTPAGGSQSTARGGVNPSADNSSLTAAQVAATQALVSQAWNSLYAARPFIKRVPQTLKKQPFGKIINVATGGADHCTSVGTVLDTPSERIRIWIPNSVAADLVNVKVAVAAMNSQYANNAPMTGSPAGSGTVASAPFTVTAGTDADRIKYTPSPWLSIQAQDRTDGGSLPAYLFRVQIPGAGNPNRPAWDNAGVTRAPMEDPANVGERVWKMRGDAVLGVDTPASVVSTAYYDLGVPFLIEYVPRGGVQLCGLYLRFKLSPQLWLQVL